MNKISVIIPVYNVQKYLRECLDSVLCQTLKEFEILCVNDASTDGSLSVLREYEALDRRIRVIDLPENRGLSGARNAGFRESSGEYVYFLDSDDMLSDREALELLYHRAIQEQADGVFFDSQVVYETEELRRQAGNVQRLSDAVEEGLYSGSEYFCGNMEGKSFIHAAWRVIWKRSYLVEKRLLFPENIVFFEDIVFNFQATVLAGRLMYFPKLLHIYRVRENSLMTSSFSMKKFLAYCQCLFITLHFISMQEPNTREQRAFCLYLTHIRTLIKDNMAGVIQNGEDLNEAVMENGWKQLCLRLILLGDYPFLGRLFTPAEYRRMKESEVVVVYGAGKAGQDVERLLKRFGIEDYQVAVTKRPLDAPGGLHEISEFIPYGDRCFVIVAVTRKYRSEMEATLDSLGLHQHICLES